MYLVIMMMVEWTHQKMESIKYLSVATSNRYYQTKNSRLRLIIIFEHSNPLFRPNGDIFHFDFNLIIMMFSVKN